MTPGAALREPLPPRLTMDEYCDWVMDTIGRMSPERIARQKAIEKRGIVPFRFPGHPCSAALPKAGSEHGHTG